MCTLFGSVIISNKQNCNPPLNLIYSSPHSFLLPFQRRFVREYRAALAKDKEGNHGGEGAPSSSASSSHQTNERNSETAATATTKPVRYTD